MIYTTFVPIDGAQAKLPVEDFERARAEVVEEIRRAPAKRVDNMLTQLFDHAQRLRLHARICSEAARDVRTFRLQMIWLVSLLTLFGFLAGLATISAQAAWWIPAAIFGGTLGTAFAGFHLARLAINRQEKQTTAGLQGIFERLYARELLVRDHSDDLQALWRAVQQKTREILEKLGLLSFRPLRRWEALRLDRAIDEEIPALRAKLHKGAPISTL
jgi:hypothetical protein